MMVPCAWEDCVATEDVELERVGEEGRMEGEGAARGEGAAKPLEVGRW